MAARTSQSVTFRAATQDSGVDCSCNTLSIILTSSDCSPLRGPRVLRTFGPSQANSRRSSHDTWSDCRDKSLVRTGRFAEELTLVASLNSSIFVEDSEAWQVVPLSLGGLALIIDVTKLLRFVEDFERADGEPDVFITSGRIETVGGSSDFWKFGGVEVRLASLVSVLPEIFGAVFESELNFRWIFTEEIGEFDELVFSRILVSFGWSSGSGLSHSMRFSENSRRSSDITLQRCRRLFSTGNESKAASSESIRCSNSSGLKLRGFFLWLIGFEIPAMQTRSNR